MSQNKVALITGANKGIGFESAKQLGKLGITVLIGARDPKKGEQAAANLRSMECDAQALTIDVTDLNSIKTAASTIEKKFGKLDILINNAGIMIASGDGPIASSVPIEVYKETFDTNFFGLIAVTQAMLPLLKKSSSGRIVNLSSILGSVGEHSDTNSSIYHAKYAAYDSTKAAVNMFTNHLAYELKETNIKVNAAHPGWVKTDMGGEMAPMELEDGAKTSVWLATLTDEGPSGGFYHQGVHMRW